MSRTTYSQREYSPRKGSGKPGLWLFRHLRPHLATTLGSLALATTAGVIATVDPLLMRRLLDRSLPSHSLESCVLMVSLIAACFIARSVFAGAGNLLGFRVSQDLGNDVRQELLENISRLSADWHDRTDLGDKLSRFDNDVEQIAQFGADSANMIVRVAVFFVLNLVIMLRLNASMTAVVLPLLPLFYYVRKRFKTTIQIRAKETQETTGEAIGRITEHLSAVPQLQLLGAIQRRIEDSFASWRRVVQSQWRQRTAEICFGLAVTLILGVAIMAVLSMGAYKYLTGAITIGTLVAFYAYTTRIFDPLSTAMDLYTRSERMFASARRILEIIDAEPSVHDRGEHSEPRDDFHLILENVSFGYSREKLILRSINLEVSSGQTVAIVGESGSGKSSLARLMVRMAEPVTGTVVLGGRNAADYKLEALRQHICYVPQAPILFRGTIRENLLYAKSSATSDELDEAIEAVGLGPILQRLTCGIDHKLESGGSGLSGGEQQRLAVARALLRKSPVLILDEATSALDVPSESMVLAGIRRLRPLCTLIVISHRVASLRFVDRCILIDDGRIAADGAFLLLQHNNPLFRSMLDIRLDDMSFSLVDRVNVYCEKLERGSEDGDLSG